MKNDNIQSIINYWIDMMQDSAETNNIHTFLPLSLLAKSTQRSYVPDPRMFIKNDFETEYQYCLFVKREDISYALIDELGFIKYDKNIDITANLLWKNHSDNHKYYFIWLYAFCTNIINNKDRIPLCSNKVFYENIEELFKCLGKHSYIKEIELIDVYSKNNKKLVRVLPDGLLHTGFYSLNIDDNDITKQIAKILLIEMLYILNTNYLIVF